MIYLNENYRIDNDDRCYIFQERKIQKKDGKERWETLSYPSTFENALTTYLRHATARHLSKQEKLKIDEAVMELKTVWADVLTEIKKAVQENE